MRRQYIALVRTDGLYAEDRWQQLLSKLLLSIDLKPVFDSPLLSIFASPSLPRQISANGVVILGDVFLNDAPWLPSQQDFQDVARTAAGILTAKCWGEYVVFVSGDSDGAAHVLRDPSGGLPCYLSQIDGIQIATSDADCLAQISTNPPSLDTTMLAYALTYEGLKTPKTCIEGVEELVSGSRVTYRDRGFEIETVWSPWAYADRSHHISSYPEAVDRVRHAIKTTLSAWASRCQFPAVELSGGLDSSIVTAALCQVCKSTEAVTLLMTDSRADERRYARTVAADAGCPLIEAPLFVEYADIRRLPETRSFRPSLGVLPMASDRAISNAVRPETDIFFSGAGGDDIFCYLSTAGSVADALIYKGIGPTTWQSVSELAAIHSVTGWTTGWYGLKKALRGPRRLPGQYQFLTKSCQQAEYMHHPWLSPPRGALPGKFEHVMSLVGAQSRGEGKDRSNRAPIRLPLLSQPVVETCLRIPTWMWTRGGRDRAVARDAFADILPATIINRRTKGDFAAFNWDIYTHNRTTIRELLLDGYLKAAGLLDAGAVESHLNLPEPHISPAYSRLVRMATVEVWARHQIGLA